MTASTPQPGDTVQWTGLPWRVLGVVTEPSVILEDEHGYRVTVGISQLDT